MDVIFSKLEMQHISQPFIDVHKKINLHTSKGWLRMTIRNYIPSKINLEILFS